MQRGYIKKSKNDLLKAIDDCKSISQLFALVQHEQIELRMQSFSSASNLPLSPPSAPKKEDSLESPLKRLKDAVKQAVINTR